MLQDLENIFERALFASRWLLAPLYMGMVVALLEILVVFARELLTQIPHVLEMDGEHAILLALSLIDLSLTANLVLIVIFAGYENFVSRINLSRDKDRPRWMGTVDFSDLKIKLIASIVAISAIALLRAFLPLADEGARPNNARLGWMVAIHLTFVISGVFLALMDYIAHKSAHGKAARHAPSPASGQAVHPPPFPAGPVTGGE